MKEEPQKSIKSENQHENKDVFLSPDGHALPRPLDPVVTMEVVQRYVEADRARSRRLLFWTSTFFLLVVLILLIMFISIGIYVVKRSHKASEIANAASLQTALYAAEVVSISNKLFSVEEKEKEIHSRVAKSEEEIAKRNRLLKNDLQRFSQWVQENLQGKKASHSDDVLEVLKARIMDLERTILRLEKTIEEEKNKASVVISKQEEDKLSSFTNAISKPSGCPEKDIFVYSNEIEVGEFATDIFEKAIAEIKVSAPTNRPVTESEISVVIFPNGDRYRGQFKDGLFHGWGVYTYANGDQYEGEFASDMKNGRGTLLYANGDKYVGSFKNDVREGRGLSLIHI